MLKLPSNKLRPRFLAAYFDFEESHVTLVTRVGNRRYPLVGTPLSINRHADESLQLTRFSIEQIQIKNYRTSTDSAGDRKPSSSPLGLSKFLNKQQGVN